MAKSQRQERARSIESAAIAGVVYAVLALVAFALLRQVPDLAGTDQEITAWYADRGHQTILIVALNLVSISAVAFLWFVAVIRRRIGDREDQFFSTVFLGSAVLYAALYMVGAVAAAAPALAFSLLDGGSVDKAAATVSTGIAGGLLLVVGPRIQAVFIFTTSTVFLRTEVMPNWLAYFGYASGAALFLIPLLIEPLGLWFPVWVFVASITIAFTRPGRLDRLTDDPPQP